MQVSSELAWPEGRPLSLVPGQPHEASRAFTPGSNAAVVLTAMPCNAQVSSVPARPGKVPLEKGYSQMDWLRRCKTEDMSGRCPAHEAKSPANAVSLPIIPLKGSVI